MERLGNWTQEWNTTTTTNNKQILSRAPLFKPSSFTSQHFSEEFSTSLLTKTSYDLVFQVCEGVEYKIKLFKNLKEFQTENFQFEVKQQNQVVMIRFSMFENFDENFNFVLQFGIQKQIIYQLTSPDFIFRSKSQKRIKREEEIQTTTKVQKLISNISTLSQENQIKIKRNLFLRCTDEQKTRLRSGSITRSC